MNHTVSMGIATNIILNLASYAMFSNLSKKTWWIGICHPLLSSSEFYVEGATHKQQKSNYLHVYKNEKQANICKE